MSASGQLGPRRFVAATATEALSMVKQAIGPDAILLSNREVDDGIEIIAMAQDQFKEIAPRATARSQGPAVQPVFSQRPRTDAGGFQEGIPVSSAADRAPRPEGLRQMSDSAIRTANHKLVIADVATSPMRNPDGSPVFAPEVAAAHFHSETGASRSRQGSNGVGQPQNLSSGQAPGLAANPAIAPQQPGPQAPASAGPQGQPALNQLAEKLMGQVAEVKHLLESHIAGNAWGQLKGVSPGRAEMLKKLLAAGFSPALATSLLEEVGEVDEQAALIATLRRPLANRIKTIDPVAMFDQGGVFAFIGPTGVGKTTTVAKIAARCVMRFGRKSVSLLSTDTYRIGALEQLRVFAKILGLPVTALRDAEDLAGRLQELEKFHVVLIDTAGMGQRDVKMVEQLKVLADGYKSMKRLLVMSATTSLQTMQDVIQAHSQGKSNGIHAALITKVDEAMSLAPSVDCLIRHDLPLLFIGNGQQVPEDLHVADPNYLAHRSLSPRSHSSEFVPNDEVVPAMIADNISEWMKKAK
ncbi:MAG: flagellar biosynthesis protein FlhF [Betaproteobacteria bacterium]|nr:flagellar biosynthesis protein FlhF [Betaproteobacteria bacterium]